MGTFPIIDPFVALVAPFWDDIDLSAGRGEVRYTLITDQEDRNFIHVERYLRKVTDATFMLSWFLVSQWIEVCPSMDNTCNQTMVYYIIHVYSSYTKNNTYHAFT